MMDTFEFSKISGAVLVALLVIFGSRTFIEISNEGHHESKAGYSLPAPIEGAAGAGAASGAAEAAKPAFDAAKVVAMMASAKPESGQATFKKCLACHSAEKGAASKAGPNLWGIIGRKKAGREDFSGYSEAIKTKGGEWTFEDFAAFVHSPKGFLPGTKMVFPGVSDPADVADLVAYVRTLSDTPAPLPN